MLHLIEDRSFHLSAEQWHGICYQMALGLRKIHAKHVLVNDVKSDNILVDCSTSDFRLKYIDMGLATFRSGFVFRGTPEYMAGFEYLSPESRAGFPTTLHSDIYSLGYIFNQICSNYYLPLLTPITAMCLSDNPSERPTLDFVLYLLENIL